MLNETKFKQRDKEEMILRNNQITGKFDKVEVLECLKGDNLEYKVEEVLSHHNYNERKYLQSLDLKGLQTKLFKNMNKCLKTFVKIEQVQMKSNVLSQNNDIADEDGDKDSIQDIQEKMSKIPYSKNGSVEFECVSKEFDIELINDINWCQNYLDQFDGRLE